MLIPGAVKRGFAIVTAFVWVGCQGVLPGERHDAGSGNDDAGLIVPAYGGEEQDAGHDPLDAGPPPEDAGSEPVDAGPMDGGSLLPDAGPPPPLWDLGMIQDSNTAQCVFAGHQTVTKNLIQYDTWNVTYQSWESIDGRLQPIQIRAFAARPKSGGTLPGLVQAHGLGGFAKPEQALSLAELTGMFAIAYTGPGGGDSTTNPRNDSEGRPASYDNGRRMFDTIPDVRGSWFWGHAVAAMRAVTCLETRSDVDPSRLGITGFSAGGVISLIVSGVDPRVKASVPLSGTHAWSIATESPTAWQHALLTQAGYTTESEQWRRLQEEIIDPTATVAHAAAKVMMVDGTTDEFFPLTAFAATFSALPGSDKRLSLAANFDHGCYTATGVESAQTIADRAALRANGAQRMWFRHWLTSDATYATVPATPTFTLTPVGGSTYVQAVVDPGQNGLSINSVEVWMSGDNAQIFAGTALDRQISTVYQKLLPLVPPPNAVTFVDVVYETPLGFERFSLSSEPGIPSGFVPQIRPISNCALQ